MDMLWKTYYIKKRLEELEKAEIKPNRADRQLKLNEMRKKLKIEENSGKKVGEIGEQKFGDSRVEVNRDSNDMEELAKETDEYIKKGKNIICQATAKCLVNNVPVGCRTDVFLKTSVMDECTLIEIKSYDNIDFLDYEDIAFQYYVFSKTRTIKKCEFMLYQCDITEKLTSYSEELFKCVDVTDKVKSKYKEIEDNIKNIISKPELKSS